jgi:hypothetical protein
MFYKHTLEDPDSANSIGQSHQRSTPKRDSSQIDYSSSLSDWSVPPTIELSPTSITSSSPDLSQNVLPNNDVLVELDSTPMSKPSESLTSASNRAVSSTCSVLPSMIVSYPKPDELLVKATTSASFNRLARVSNTNAVVIDDKKLLTSSSSTHKLSVSPRLRRRRRDHDNMIFHHQTGRIHKSKAKSIKIHSDNCLIVEDLLNDMIKFVLQIFVLE